ALAPRIDPGGVELSRPIPPLASWHDIDGSVVGAVTVGLREAPPAGGGPVTHRVVAVTSADGDILTDAPGLPGPAHQECGVPDAGSPPPTAGGQEGDDQARVRVWRGDDLLWDLVVVRPSASSGSVGSGVELRNVDYQRVRALYRAHVPIVNVAY